MALSAQKLSRSKQDINSFVEQVVYLVIALAGESLVTTPLCPTQSDMFFSLFPQGGGYKFWAWNVAQSTIMCKVGDK